MSTVEAFSALLDLLDRSGAAFRVHEHADTRTIEEARANLDFDVTRIVKTVAFGARDGRLVLAALRGTRRVDYAKLAVLVGVNRRELASLAPQEVLERLGVEPGSVSPLLPAAARIENVLVLLDDDALGITPTLYCGLGRPDRTLELAPSDLARLSLARAGAFSR
ncbi:MAG: YbaK/EbsC family protein [Humidesulfovibrio sp.]|nr:YbaK/EbsC family protein [Humidesulfovibrio sp.]